MKRWPLAWISLASAVAAGRAYYVLTRLDPSEIVFSDMQFYFDNARQMLEGQFNAQALWKPLGYPLWLTLSMWLHQAGLTPRPETFAYLANVMMLTALPMLMFAAAYPWLGGLRAGAVAAVGLLHFQLTGFAGLHMPEVFLSFVLALMVLILCRARFPWSGEVCAALGFLWGVAMLLKGQGLLIAPLLALWLVTRLKFSRALVTAGLFFVAGAAVPLGGIEIFKRSNYDSLLGGGAIAAVAWVTGKCTQCQTVVDGEGVTWGATVYHQSGDPGKRCEFKKPFRQSGAFWRFGARCVVDDPLVLLTSLAHVHYLFWGNTAWPLSHIEQTRRPNSWSSVALSLLLTAGLAAAAIRHYLCKQRERAAELLGVICVAVMLLAYLLHSELRHRVPFDVAFVPLAVWGLAGRGQGPSKP